MRNTIRRWSAYRNELSSNFPVALAVLVGIFFCHSNSVDKEIKRSSWNLVLTRLVIISIGSFPGFGDELDGGVSV